MPILPLTARTVAGLRAPYDQARIEYFDAETPGLCLRITSDGVKTWALIYRHHGRKRRLTLGRFPDLGLADARGKAVRARGRILGGADPAAEKHDERATYGDTVGALFTLFTQHYERRKSWPELRRIYEHDVLPVWRHRRVQDITRRETSSASHSSGIGSRRIPRSGCAGRRRKRVATACSPAPNSKSCGASSIKPTRRMRRDGRSRACRRH